MNDYYVYVILNLDIKGPFKYGELEFDYLPIYVGKGKNKRQSEHFKPYSLKVDSEKNKSLLKYKCEAKIVKDGLSEDESLKLERYYIDLIGRLDINTGPLTNLTSGGQGVSGYKYTIKQLLVRSNQQSTTGNGFYNKKHKSDSFNQFKRGVYQVDILTGEIISKFDSLSDAAKSTSSDEAHIRQCCNGIRRTHNGFIWKDVDDSYIKKRRSKGNSTKLKSIIQLDLDNNVIKEFDSISSCSRETGIRKSNIINCLQDRRMTAGGFKWKYKPENIKESIIIRFGDFK